MADISSDDILSNKLIHLTLESMTVADSHSDEHKIKLDTFVVRLRAIYLFYGPIRHTADAFFCKFFVHIRSLRHVGRSPHSLKGLRWDLRLYVRK